MRTLVLASAASLLLVPFLSEASSLRCGSHIAAEGSSMVETLRKCGEPISKNVRTVVDTVRVKEKGETQDVTHERAVVTVYEEWTYNFGPNFFLQVVTFQDGRLLEVESGEYGF